MEQSAMETLKEELESDELYLRVNAIHRMSIVATILGIDGIKNQLVPFIDQLIKKEEDEVLYAIAAELNNIGPIMGNQITIIIPFLEQLASSEETVVRERAIESLINISSNHLQESDITNQYIPMILRLANNDINFTCRISAVKLMVPIYKKASHMQEKIRLKFTELCGEETPMVRRSVASLIGEFATVIEKEYVISDLIGSVKQLIQDDQDQVRVLGLNSLKSVAKVLSREENRQLTLQIIIAATEDKSWRVRLSLSSIFAELAEAFGREVADVSLIQIFTNLLRDAENEVRQASIKSLAKFIKIISAQKLVIILPHLQYLAKDSVPQIRVGTYQVIGIMSGLLQNKEMITSKLLPHLLESFSDENKEVKEVAMTSSAQFCVNIGFETVSQFVPHYSRGVDIKQDWRVRLEAYKALIKISTNFYNPDVFQSQIEPILIQYLKDKTASVRIQISEAIGAVVAKYKNDWVYSKFVPKLVDCLKSEHYHFRAVAINSLKTICKVLNNDQSVDKIFPILYKHLNDPVVNIRIFITQAFVEITPKYESSSTRNDIKQHIQQLANDSDKDVKFYVNEILAIIGK